MDRTTESLLPLWAAVFGEPPAVVMDAATMIAIMVDVLPEPKTFVPAVDEVDG